MLGQGYIWMAHKTPGSDLWDFGLRSQRLWEDLTESLSEQGLDPLQILGWKKTVANLNPEESDMLKGRVKLLCEAGLRAEYLSAIDLLVKEPELMVDKDTGAAFLPDDCQLDARRAVEFLEKGNRHYSSKGRYAEFYNDPVISLLRSGGSGEVEAIKTSRNILYTKKAIVVAAGCWSGSLMCDLLRESEVVLDVPVKPRKGHLLVLENFNSFQLNHGLMEVGYVDHQTAIPLPNISTSGLLDHDGQTLSVSMTATMDTAGNIVLVSYESKDIRLILDHVPDGKPVIGPVPGVANVFLATGHEGGGLSMALGTAEMLADMVIGNPEK
ncbi:FAD-dependent oxidoreductase family protein, partial [Prunus dulcis]